MGITSPNTPLAACAQTAFSGFANGGGVICMKRKIMDRGTWLRIIERWFNKAEIEGFEGHQGIRGTPYLILDFRLVSLSGSRMARIARVVASGLPHHVTQQGNRREEPFFCEEDYQQDLGLMSEWCSRWGVEVWAYCLILTRCR